MSHLLPAAGADAAHNPAEQPLSHGHNMEIAPTYTISCHSFRMATRIINLLY